MMYIHYLQTTYQLDWREADNLVYQVGQNQQRGTTNVEPNRNPEVPGWKHSLGTSLLDYKQSWQGRYII